MKQHLRHVLLFGIALLTCSSTAWAQGDPTGAWQVVEVWGTDSDEGDWKTENVQPGLYLFLDGYYSSMHVQGEEARPQVPEGKSMSDLSTEEVLAIWGPFIANSGTYEVSGSTLTTKPMVAKSPSFMDGGSSTMMFEVKGDELHLSGTYNNGTWKSKSKRLN